MARARITFDQINAGGMPQVCMCCGGRAATSRDHKFRWKPTWSLVLNLLPVRFLVHTHGNVAVPAPLCRRHTNRLKLPLYVNLTMFGILVAGFGLVAVAAIASEAFAVACLGVVGWMFLVFVAIVVAWYFEFTTPRAENFTDDYVEFASISPRFAAAVGSVAVPSQGMPPVRRGPQARSGSTA